MSSVRCTHLGYTDSDGGSEISLKEEIIVALVRTDVSEELSASIIRVTRIGELGTTLALTSNRRTLRRNSTNV
jgi:hypothetical protein